MNHFTKLALIKIANRLNNTQLGPSDKSHFLKFSPPYLTGLQPQGENSGMEGMVGIMALAEFLKSKDGLMPLIPEKVLSESRPFINPARFKKEPYMGETINNGLAAISHDLNPKGEFRPSRMLE